MTEEKLRKLFQNELSNGTKFSGWCRNVYGDTEKIKAILEEELSKVTITESQSSATPTQKMIVVKVRVEDEWAAKKEPKCRQWIVWKSIINQIQKANLGTMKSENLKEETVTTLNKNITDCFNHFSKTIEEIANDTDTDSIRNKLLMAFRIFRIQLIIVMYNYDAIKAIFPKTEEAGGAFFQDLFGLSTKSNDNNRCRIVIVSGEPASGYAHHMSGGSSFLAAYPQISLEEGTGNTDDKEEAEE